MHDNKRWYDSILLRVWCFDVRIIVGLDRTMGMLLIGRDVECPGGIVWLTETQQRAFMDLCHVWHFDCHCDEIKTWTGIRN